MGRRSTSSTHETAACRPELTAPAPETAHRPEHELLAGLLAEHGEAIGKQVLEREMLPSQRLQQTPPRLLRRGGERGHRTHRIECSRKPPVVEVGRPQTRVYMFRRRSD